MRTLKRAFLILETLAGEAKKLSLVEIAEKTRIDKATCLRFLTSLEDIGLVRRDQRTRLYEMGPKAIFLSSGFLKTFRVEDRVRPYLERLATETEETAFYSVRKGSSRVPLYVHESRHVTRTQVEIGVAVALTNGCISRAILAFLPEQEIDQLLKESIVPATPWSIINPKQIRKSIAEVRARGYSVGIREIAQNTNAVAAPVFNGDGVIASMAIVGPTERLTKKACEKFGPVVRDSARKVSEEMGFHPVEAFGYAGAKKVSSA
ncbi:MAG TPA: IclR family transcriptional regulator [Candidatus Binatia bacterium]|nr:IclR family transcriptional regulator [Candidatus Binatia bacterium]